MAYRHSRFFPATSSISRPTRSQEMSRRESQLVWLMSERKRMARENIKPDHFWIEESDLTGKDNAFRAWNKGKPLISYRPLPREDVRSQAQGENVDVRFDIDSHCLLGDQNSDFPIHLYQPLLDYISSPEEPDPASTQCSYSSGTAPTSGCRVGRELIQRTSLNPLGWPPCYAIYPDWLLSEIRDLLKGESDIETTPQRSRPSPANFSAAVSPTCTVSTLKLLDPTAQVFIPGASYIYCESGSFIGSECSFASWSGVADDTCSSERAAKKEDTGPSDTIPERETSSNRLGITEITDACQDYKDNIHLFPKNQKLALIKAPTHSPGYGWQLAAPVTIWRFLRSLELRPPFFAFALITLLALSGLGAGQNNLTLNHTINPWHAEATFQEGYGMVGGNDFMPHPQPAPACPALDPVARLNDLTPNAQHTRTIFQEGQNTLASSAPDSMASNSTDLVIWSRERSTLDLEALKRLPWKPALALLGFLAFTAVPPPLMFLSAGCFGLGFKICSCVQLKLQGQLPLLDGIVASVIMYLFVVCVFQKRLLFWAAFAFGFIVCFMTDSKPIPSSCSCYSFWRLLVKGEFMDVRPDDERE